MLPGWTTITIEWAFAVLSLIFVLLRIYVRFTAPSTIHHLSDAIVICAWLAFVGMVACDSALSRLHLPERASIYDAGLLKLNQRPEDSLCMLKIIYASVLPYTLVLYLVKAAIVTWYYTITPRTLPRCRLALHLISAACLAGFCLAVGLNGFSCYPVHRNWALDPASLCIASARPWAFFVSFGCHLATEILIFVYPFPLLRSIRTARARPRRWSIIFLFILGSLAIVATCARVIAIAISATAPVVAAWTTIECTANILVACCPALRVLIQSKKPASRIHDTMVPSLKNNLGSVDTYVSGNNNTGTSHQLPAVQSGIWDGTESTAPDWIRLESRQLADGGDLERGSVCQPPPPPPPPGLGGGRDCISAFGRAGGGGGGAGGGAGGHRITPPALVFHPKRGIVQHAPGLVPQSEGTPCWMDIPEIPFLRETEPEEEERGDSGGGGTRRCSTSSTTKHSSVRWDISEEQPRSCSGGGGPGGKAPLLKRRGD